MRIVCQTCGIEGYLQHIGKNYYRVRHYVGFTNGKPKFKYHRQDPEYVAKVLKPEEKIDHIDPKDVDPNKLKSVSINKNKQLRGCPSLVGGRPAKPVVLRAARVQIPHPAPTTHQSRTFKIIVFIQTNILSATVFNEKSA